MTIESIDQKFKSGNDVAVSRAIVTREEWEAVKAELFTPEQVRDACEKELESWPESDFKDAAKHAIDSVRLRLIETKLEQAND